MDKNFLKAIIHMGYIKYRYDFNRNSIKGNILILINKHGSMYISELLKELKGEKITITNMTLHRHVKDMEYNNYIRTEMHSTETGRETYIELTEIGKYLAVGIEKQGVAEATVENYCHCGRFIGHRGFCSEKCHNEHYDNLPTEN